MQRRVILFHTDLAHQDIKSSDTATGTIESLLLLVKQFFLMLLSILNFNNDVIVHGSTMEIIDVTAWI